jgi:hypothetical protein
MKAFRTCPDGDTFFPFGVYCGGCDQDTNRFVMPMNRETWYIVSHEEKNVSRPFDARPKHLISLRNGFGVTRS